MFERELAFAHETADRAAEIGLEFFRNGFEVMTKADSSPVTEADLAIEAMVRERIADAFPGDAVLGEEQGGADLGGRTWILDPIDATKNFALGIQIWGTLIADGTRSRAFGDFWGHVLVARGAAELMVEPELNVWDYAAPQLITEEAGGRVTTMEGGPTVDGGSVLTTNGLLHDELVERFASG